MKPLPDAEALSKQLRYDEKTGRLFRRSGRRADKPSTVGYQRVYVDGQRYYAHRVIWKMKTGEDPDQVDHENGNRADNRWHNLRAVSKRENALNKRLSGRNKSGASGVCRHSSGKWIAEIQCHGRREYLGIYADFSDAVSARKSAEARLGFHENHGV